MHRVNSIAIGTETVANSIDAFAAGFKASALANNAMALGTAAYAKGLDSFAGGYNANATGASSSCIRRQYRSDQSQVCSWFQLQSNRHSSHGIRCRCQCWQDPCLCSRSYANAAGTNSMALGTNATATEDSAMPPATTMPKPTMQQPSAPTPRLSANDVYAVGFRANASAVNALGFCPEANASGVNSMARK